MAFNPLAFLLGQQSSSTIPQAVDPEILVQGRVRDVERPTADMPRYGDAPSRPEVIPRYILNDDRIAPQPEELDEILPRKGMFGVKGTLRDVLGVLGDAFLVQGGGKAIYQPQRERERAGDALFGFSQEPEQAIERLTAVNPELAAEVQNQYLQNQYQQGMLESTNANRKDQANNRLRDDLRTARNQVGRWMQAADTPAKQAVALRYVERMANELGVTMEDLGFDTDGLSEDERAILAAGDMTVNQQVQVPFKERSLDIAQQNADAHTTNANRPRASAQPRAQTDREAFFEIGKIPPEKRTQFQKDFYEKYAHGTRRGLLDSLGVDTPTSTGKSRFRPVK